MQRETKTFSTPSGVEVVYRPYLIGSERRQLQNIYIDNGIGTDGRPSALTSKITDAVQDLAWKLLVVSVGGKTENVGDEILALRSDDYDAVVREINAVVTGRAAEEKKTI